MEFSYFCRKSLLSSEFDLKISVLKKHPFFFELHAFGAPAKTTFTILKQEVGVLGFSVQRGGPPLDFFVDESDLGRLGLK